jgi:tetratricopeptide (TPR) repeat protein
MSTAVLTNRLELSSVAATALKAAARFWFGVTVIGQLVFAFAIASFYGLTALRGDYHGWRFTNGYVPGVTRGNWAVVMHVASAAVIMLAGAMQLVPQVRNRFPVFHHWNGRIYMLTAVTLSLAGLYMTWIRGSVGDLSQHLSSTLNAILMWLFAAFALRFAMARDFKTHRRWALRLFLVVSGSWFYRIALFLSFLIFKGPVGFDPTTFTGPFLTFMGFAQYLFPLAVLEIYFLAQDRPSALRRLATAGLIFVLTLAMVAGLFAATMAVWVPDVKAAFDPRRSIAETLSATIASSGVDAAIQQYHDLKAQDLRAHDLKAARPTTYNFDENELNSLGYRLLNAKKFKDAIRILQLNAEAYPQSSNVYDSLGEAYIDDGNKPLAIANYRKSVQLNPKNRNAVVYLQKLNAQ